MGRFFVLFFSLFSFVGVSAYAQEPMRYEVLERHLAHEPAQLRIIANSELSDVSVRIDHCAGEPVAAHFDAIHAGEIKLVQWPQPAGDYRCGVRIDGLWNGGAKWHVVRNHDFRSALPMSLEVNLRELSPDASSVMLHASHPFKKAAITVSDEEGEIIDSREVAVPSVRDFKLSWTPNGSSPALLEIRIDDGLGAWATNTIFYFTIPHTDIVFDTAKSTIRRDQESSLRDSLDKILGIIAHHERVAVDLYITGYTDTVGSVQSNDRLSRDRAKAIAAWFRANGLKIPTYYRGAGERVLAVQTPDETPNEQNRRAVYILSNRPPVDGVPQGTFIKL